MRACTGFWHTVADEPVKCTDRALDGHDVCWLHREIRERPCDPPHPKHVAAGKAGAPTRWPNRKAGRL